MLRSSSSFITWIFILSIVRCETRETDARKSAGIETASISPLMQSAMQSAVIPADATMHEMRATLTLLNLCFFRRYSSSVSSVGSGLGVGGLFGEFFFTELFVVSSAGRGMRSRGRDGLY